MNAWKHLWRNIKKTVALKGNAIRSRRKILTPREKSGTQIYNPTIQ